MSEVKKLNSPLKFGADGIGVYPLTSYDQIILPDGSRWNGISGGGNSSSNESTLNLLYPIGSIYTSTQPTSPSQLFGGTWARIKDTFLLTAGDTYAAGSTGGETLHNHNYGIQFGYHYGEIVFEDLDLSGVLVYDENGNFTINNGTVVTQKTTNLNKSTQSAYASVKDMVYYREVGTTTIGNNLPPYRVVYAWERTA